MNVLLDVVVIEPAATPPPAEELRFDSAGLGLAELNLIEDLIPDAGSGSDPYNLNKIQLKHK